MEEERRPRVVVVEDHALTRAGLRTALAPVSDVVAEAADGIAGWNAISRERPDVAVIVLTGQDDEYLGEQAVKAGAQDYLVKGDVSGKLLLRVMRYAMERGAGTRPSGSCRSPG